MIKLLELKTKIEARVHKITSEMDTEIEAIREEENFRKIPIMSTLPDNDLRHYAVLLARGRKIGEAEALQFVLENLKEMIED